MSLNFDHLAQQQKTGIDTNIALGSIALNSAERGAALGIESSRQLLAAQGQWSSRLLAVRSAQDFAALQADLSAPLIERGIGLARQSYEISAEAGESLGKLIESSYADGLKSFSGLIDDFARQAPAGAEPAVAALRSGVDAVSNAVGRINDVARQVAEATEANVAASSKATLKVVNAGASANSSNAAAKKKIA